eukprot:scaffold2470_cov21-Tisochrysis_lutea.AAC.1
MVSIVSLKRGTLTGVSKTPQCSPAPTKPHQLEERKEKGDIDVPSCEGRLGWSKKWCLKLKRLAPLGLQSHPCPVLLVHRARGVNSSKAFNSLACLAQSSLFGTRIL